MKYGTNSGSCPLTHFGVNGVESFNSAATELAVILIPPIFILYPEPAFGLTCEALVVHHGNCCLTLEPFVKCYMYIHTYTHTRDEILCILPAETANIRVFYHVSLRSEDNNICTILRSIKTVLM